jgi:hypothetical protein
MIVAALLSTVGCHVHVDKGQNGEDKNVKIDTPLGGLHVRADQTSASDLGLPLYPGAQVASDEGDKSADVHMGFGKWQLHVRVVTYRSADPQDKVLAFYKNALGRYGDVLECDGNQPVGTPTITSEGLTCREDKNVHVNSGGGNSTGIEDSGLSLRAGSPHHQHVLAFKTASAGTKFTMVEMQLPGGQDDKSGKTD